MSLVFSMLQALTGDGPRQSLLDQSPEAIKARKECIEKGYAIGRIQTDYRSKDPNAVAVAQLTKITPSGQHLLNHMEDVRKSNQ